MKLKSLYIKKYKNLSGTYNFECSNSYIALIGLNGSGKSNLLEVISIVFRIITGLCPENIIGDFSFTYEIDGRVYYAEFWEKNGKLFINNTQRKPSSIISCYSGEDDRLWKHGYKDYYIKFFNAAIAGGDYKPTSLYINKHCWEIAFISLLFSENEEVKRFVSDKLHVNHDTVTIQFKTKENTNPQPHDASNWYKRVETKYSGAEISINDLINNEEVELLCGKYPYLTNDQIVFYYLYFLYMPDKRGILGLEADKIIESIDIKLNGFNFDGLSEGHKKLILIECITKVLGDENSLILLDEPDAHVHIALKKEILNCINDFEGQTLLTTHSPIFANQMAEENVFPIIDGKILPLKKRALIQKIANNEINIIDSACVVSSKHLIVTEGPGDINYITAAIQACGKDDVQYKVLEKASFVYTGGAKQVEVYYDEILSDLYDTLEKIVFVFDLDSEGREGAKLAQKLIDEGKDKIKIVFYNINYPIVDPDNNDFYLEDMFPRNAYNIVSLPHINGEPTYAQLRKGNTLAISIKNKIAELYKKKLLKDEDYYSFKPFLRQLKSELGL